MGEYSVLQLIRQQHPVVHAITNPVTMHDVVNMILASGASAICADAPEETAEITGLCDGLLINTGMPEQWKLEAMLRAGTRANERGIPVVLDPVGAGASPFRKQFLRQLLEHIQFACIRCNMSEAAALLGIAFRSRGVEDAGVVLSGEELQTLAAEYHTVLAVTGAVDYTVTSQSAAENTTGTPLEKSITGAGCMLSGLMAAALAASRKAHKTPEIRRDPADFPGSGREDALVQEDAAAAGALLREYGRQAAAAEQRMRSGGACGTATFRTYFIDAVSQAAGVLDPGRNR